MILSVPFYGTCSARSELVIVSQRITYPFVVRELQYRFPLGCQNLMQLKFFLSEDSSEPSSGEPSGFSLLSLHSDVDYVVGDNSGDVFEHNVSVDHGNSYLKMYANNTDYYDHDVIARITIEAKERG